MQLAALKNLDYPTDKLSINYAVTYYPDVPDCPKYDAYIRKLVEAAGLKCPWHITRTTPDEDELEHWGTYALVIRNLHELRKQFLDGDADYFWVLGGDNFPLDRHMLKKLLKMKTDVASPVIAYRPSRQPEGKRSRNRLEPIAWTYLWWPDDIEREDIQPEVREALWKAWMNVPMTRFIRKKEKIVHGAMFGSGCSLSTREAQMYAAYWLPPAGYMSEDLNYTQHLVAYGFDVAVNTTLRCGHFETDGHIY
jgi:hypothetical protein